MKFQGLPTYQSDLFKRLLDREYAEGYIRAAIECESPEVVEVAFKNLFEALTGEQEMWIKHPYENVIINTRKYADIRCCVKNPTHIDFYEKAVPEGERGEPQFTIKFKTKEEKEAWFDILVRDSVTDPSLEYGEEEDL